LIIHSIIYHQLVIPMTFRLREMVSGGNIMLML